MMQRGRHLTRWQKCLGLHTPEAPQMARVAENGIPGRFIFPRPMTGKPGLDFSFSGLKTFVLNTIHDQGSLTAQDKADIAWAFQEAVVDTIRIKCQRAIEHTGLDNLVIAGGVSANQLLRARLQVMTEKKGCSLHFPAPNLCTDNGAMIAYAGYLRLVSGQRDNLEIQVRPRWPMDQLAPGPGDSIQTSLQPSHT